MTDKVCIVFDSIGTKPLLERMLPTFVHYHLYKRAARLLMPVFNRNVQLPQLKLTLKVGELFEGFVFDERFPEVGGDNTRNRMLSFIAQQFTDLDLYKTLMPYEYENHAMALDSQTWHYEINGEAFDIYPIFSWDSDDDEGDGSFYQFMLRINDLRSKNLCTIDVITNDGVLTEITYKIGSDYHGGNTGT